MALTNPLFKQGYSAGNPLDHPTEIPDPDFMQYGDKGTETENEVAGMGGPGAAMAPRLAASYQDIFRQMAQCEVCKTALHRAAVLRLIQHLSRDHNLHEQAEKVAQEAFRRIHEYKQQMMKGTVTAASGEKEAGPLSKAMLPAALMLGLGAPSTLPERPMPKQPAPIVQQVQAPATQRDLDDIVDAISRAEGAKPELHNPGNLVDFNTGQIKAFPDDKAGENALKKQLLEIASGTHPKIKPEMTLAEAGMIYSNGDPNWAKNVHLILGVPKHTKMKDLIPKTGAAKPKCPHCGSTNYSLMPSDFETAKCKDCGKNWNHGIVEGINDPKTARKWVEPKAQGEFVKESDPPIEVLAKVAHANFPDPGTLDGILDGPHYDEKQEKERREDAERFYQYAESGPTSDPAGDYLCGTCEMRSGADQCTHVDGKISFTTGSCQLYKHGPSEGQAPLEKKADKASVGYTERPNVRGFGCARCHYSVEAAQPDSAGRDTWCERWGFHNKPLACCAKNEGDDDVEFNKDGSKKASFFVPLSSLMKSADTVSFGYDPLKLDMVDQPTMDQDDGGNSDDDKKDDDLDMPVQAAVDFHPTTKTLPPRADMQRHLDQDIQKEIDDDIDKPVQHTGDQHTADRTIMPEEPRPSGQSSYGYDPGMKRNVKPIAEDPHRPAAPSWVTGSQKKADDPDWNPQIDEIQSMEAEAREAFLNDSDMQQEAAQSGETMDQLWAVLRTDYANEFFAQSV